MPNLTPEQLAALREAAEKATKGEWSFHKADNSPGAVVYGVRIEDCGRSIDCWSLTYNGEGAANAAYIVAAQPRVMLELLAERERLAGRVRELEGDPRDVTPDTGHPEADRVLGRLASADPDFADCHDAAVLIRRLVADNRGPSGHATWKDAAIAERLRATAAEADRDRLRAALAETAAQVIAEMVHVARAALAGEKEPKP